MSSIEASLLFKLPLELREQIYKATLTRRSNGPELLRTCREIYAESHKFLFYRPVCFQSQARLYTWLDQVPEHFLQYVIDVTVHVQDVNLQPLLGSNYMGTLERHAPRLHTWELYEQDMERLTTAFGRLPNVESLTLRALPSRQSFLYREFLTNILGTLGTTWPDIQALRLEGNMHYQKLDFLSNLPGLRSFLFDGFMASSPTETSQILSGMRQLENLSLSQHSMLTTTDHPQSVLTSKRQCLTDEVVQAMSHLTSFSVTERRFPSFPALFFTPEILSSLKTHKKLCCLSFMLSQVPSLRALEALETCLMRSSIEYLELDWPNFDSQLLVTYNFFPRSLKEFRVRTHSISTAFDVLRTILAYREANNVPEMRRVVLIREKRDNDSRVRALEQGSIPTASETYSDNPSAAMEGIGKANFERAKEQLNAFGVQVLWCTDET